MVFSPSPLDHCGIEFKIRQQDEFRALYEFVSSFAFLCMCAWVRACASFFFFWTRSTSIKENQTSKKSNLIFF
jgi:hypothetical protein